jgi:hypothetical protein
MLVISSRGHPMGMPHRPPGRKGGASLRSVAPRPHAPDRPARHGTACPREEIT